jgi:hypothetical protein
MIHLELQLQSLCLRPHLAHSQWVHQIHFKWFSSRMISAMHQSRIWV